MWKVECEPEGKNTNNRNEGAMVVFLSNGTKREELTSVAVARRHSAHPEVSFEDQLEAEIRKAKTAARLANELDELTNGAAGRLR